MHTTHYSALSVVLIAKAAPNADMSLIWFSLRLQGRYVNNGLIKSQHTDNSLQLCQRIVGGQGCTQR